MVLVLRSVGTDACAATQAGVPRPDDATGGTVLSGTVPPVASFSASARQPLTGIDCALSAATVFFCPDASASASVPWPDAAWPKPSEMSE